MCRDRSTWRVRGVVLLAGLSLAVAALSGQAGEAVSKPGTVWLDPVHYDGLLRQRVSGLRPPEFMEYVYWNVTGSGSGWFHPGQSRYGWKWLADRYDIDHNGKISRQEFQGPAEFFERLDRDHNGVLTAADFDWSDPAPEEMRSMMAGQVSPRASAFGRQDMLSRLPEMMSHQLFSRIDTNSNGRISRAEWLAVFTRAAKGKDYLTPGDLREALPFSLPRRAGQPMQQRPGLVALIRILGMFKGETGSFFEGPDVGQRAPDFTLKTQDGKQTIRLSSYRGHKPVVLVFGNFT